MALIKCSECGSEVSTKADACPKCGAKIKKRSKLVTYGGGFVAVVIAVSIIGSIADNNEASQSSAPASVQQPNTPMPAAQRQPAAKAIQVSAARLYADYQANEIQADNKYKGKVLAVRGAVVSINKDIMGDPYIVLGKDELEGVQAQFSPSSAAKLATLHKNDVVTVTCVGAGMMLTSPMLDCKNGD